MKLYKPQEKNTATKSFRTLYPITLKDFVINARQAMKDKSKYFFAL